MMELLWFIFALAFYAIAFKLTFGCLRVVFWFFGFIFFASAVLSILI